MTRTFFASRDLVLLGIITIREFGLPNTMGFSQQVFSEIVVFLVKFFSFSFSLKKSEDESHF